MYTITLDPGHGGNDAGASGHGYKEKDLVLKMVLDVEKAIKKLTSEIKTILTRRTDKYVSLQERANIANRNNSDAFLSEHLNSAAANTAKGTETFHYRGSKEGRELATTIQDEIANNGLTLADRGVKEAGFAVLKNTKMKAGLIEACFINNKEDLDFFLKNYDKFISVISNAILKHFKVKPNTSNTGIKPEAPKKPNINTVEGKINIMLIGEHIATEGFYKDGTSYVDVNGSYLSIRKILENLHLDVGWDNDLKLITADTTSNFIKVENPTDVLLLGNKINVKMYKHENKHCLKIENAYIPVRNIFENLGFKVEWNRSNNMILVNK